LANQLAKNGAKSKWPRFSLTFFGVRLRVSRRRRLEHSDVHKNVNAAATTTSANALEPQPHENMPLGLNCQSGWVGLDWPGLAWLALGFGLKTGHQASVAPCSLCRSLWSTQKCVCLKSSFGCCLVSGKWN